MGGGVGFGGRPAGTMVGGPSGMGGSAGGPCGMGGASMGGPSRRSGGPMAMGGAPGGGGRPDPDKPFESERNKKALDDLIGELK